MKLARGWLGYLGYLGLALHGSRFFAIRLLMSGKNNINKQINTECSTGNSEIPLAHFFCTLAAAEQKLNCKAPTVAKTDHLMCV